MMRTSSNLGPRFSFWVAWLFATALFLLPVRVNAAESSGLDKLAHFAILATLGYLGLATYVRRRYTVVGLLLVYTFLIEYVQGTYLPHRTLDWYDAVAGSVGLIVVFFTNRFK